MENDFVPQARQPERRQPIVQQAEPLPNKKTEEEIRREAQKAEGGASIGADRTSH